MTAEFIEYLTPYEHTRRALHRSIDRICDSWPLALEDANSRGYPTGIDYNVRRSSSENTSVETAALNESKAVAWLADLEDLLPAYDIHTFPDPRAVGLAMHFVVQDDNLNEHAVRVTIRLANMASLLWPPTPKPGTTRNGTTIGGRTNSIENCVYCQQPVTGGAQDPIRRINNEPYHKTPCWYAVTISRGQHPRQKAEK